MTIDDSKHDPDYFVKWYLDENGNPQEGTFDLGDDHYGRWFSWSPDRELNPQYADRPDVEKLGFNILHKKGPNDNRGAYRDSAWCCGGVTLNVPGSEHFPGPKWELRSIEPLHIEPSVACGCGDHGWIRDGKWVKA